jgi:threonine dehydrogenase-like Zn-dependent dehydrogenase
MPWRRRQTPVSVYETQFLLRQACQREGTFRQVAASTIILKGLTIHGAWRYNLCDAGRLMQVIAASGAQLDRLTTHRFPMSRVQEVWELQLTGNCGKVILDPWA